jgi:uncharacterized repeat protein (TIGR01451 family)
MTLTRSTDKSVVLPGDTVTFTITYSNIGSAAATFVTIVDPTPNNSVYIPLSMVVNSIAMSDAVDGDAASVVNNQILINVGIVQPGQSGTIHWKLQIR